MSEPNHLSEHTLNEYLDGALTPETRQSVETHLASCAICSDQLADLQLVFTSLETLPEASLERDLVEPVLAELSRAAPTWAAGRWILLIQILLTIAVLFFSWPIVRQFFGLAQIPLLQLDLISTSSQWAFDMQASLSEAVAGITASVQSAQAWIDGVYPAPLAEFNLWPWVIALGLCALLVNLFYLRPSSQEKANGN